jgi:hypothetical protein
MRAPVAGRLRRPAWALALLVRFAITLQPFAMVLVTMTVLPGVQTSLRDNHRT